MDSVRVAIVDDDRGAREGLAFLIGATAGYRCVGTFESMEDALSAHGETPDVVLLDIHLPGMSGIEGVRALREKHPTVEILMLTVYDDQPRVFAAICAGASGYLLKNTPPSRLLEAVRDVHSGGAPMSPEIARSVVRLFRQAMPAPDRSYALTPQEVRLLGLLAQGHSYRSAGEQLHVTENTIRNYIRSIYDKLHVHSKSEAVTKALRRGIIG
jgi:DNA-binding NarL/FixJ family response regulator